MKKIKGRSLCVICVVLASAAALVLLCSGRLNGGAKPEVRPLEELQGSYSLDDAIADGCFVIEDGSVTNLDVLERFVRDAEATLRSFGSMSTPALPLTPVPTPSITSP